MKDRSSKWVFALLLWLVIPSASADPHFVQVLHPYWGHDEKFDEYLSRFDEPVSVDVGEFTSSYETDMYIYIYIVSAPRAYTFAISVDCPPENESANERATTLADVSFIAPDPVRKNAEPVITKDYQVSWPLDSGAERQGMWFYSESPPVDREYRLTTVRSGDSDTMRYHSGILKGPSCRAQSQEERGTSSKGFSVIDPTIG